MKTLTPDGVRKLDRAVLESSFLQLQSLQSATRARTVITEQRIMLIEQHLQQLGKHVHAGLL